MRERGNESPCFICRTRNRRWTAVATNNDDEDDDDGLDGSGAEYRAALSSTHKVKFNKDLEGKYSRDLHEKSLNQNMSGEEQSDPMSNVEEFRHRRPVGRSA